MKYCFAEKMKNYKIKGQTWLDLKLIDFDLLVQKVLIKHIIVPIFNTHIRGSTRRQAIRQFV